MPRWWPPHIPPSISATSRFASSYSRGCCNRPMKVAMIGYGQSGRSTLYRASAREHRQERAGRELLEGGPVDTRGLT